VCFRSIIRIQNAQFKIAFPEQGTRNINIAFTKIVTQLHSTHCQSFAGYFLERSLKNISLIPINMQL
jgi:hypothetical protein